MNDPYPNDGTFFQPTVPDQTKQDNEAELKRIAQLIPAIDELIDFFDAAIEETDSITAATSLAKELDMSRSQVEDGFVIARRKFLEKKEELANLKLNIPS